MKMDRRSFVKTGGLVLGGITLGGDMHALDKINGSASASAASKKAIGLQLYSLRDDIDKNCDETLRQVAKIGYRTVEGYGGFFFGKKPEEFKKFLADLGVRMTSMHTGFNVFNGNEAQGWDAMKKNMSEVRTAGAKWIVQAGYPGEKYTKLDQVKALAETFNKVGEEAKAQGLKFAYHNHRSEYRAVENQIPYQKLLEWTDKSLVSFEMDLGHVANEMADYLIYLIKYPGRFGALHIRDTNIFTKVATEMGTGDVRLKEAFDLFGNAGVEDYFVEQEEYNFAPLVSVKMCYDYLAKADFVKW